VAPAFDGYAKELCATLKASSLRVRADLSDSRMNAKIREAQGKKIPYMLVVGQKEMDEKTLSLRMRDGRQENGLTVDAFIARVKDLVEKKSLEL